MTVKEFEEFAHRIRPRLVSMASGIVDTVDEAEDLAQDTMLRLWGLRDQLDEYRSVESLAVVICRRMALNVVRSRKRCVAIEDATYLHDDFSPEERLLRIERDETVDKIFAALPESQQALIRLRHVDGYDNATIAAIIGSTEGAVRTALCRARQRVAQMFINS